MSALKEKSRGVFYRGGRATLHFHEDPLGLFADLRLGAEWRRLPVNSKAERAALVRELGRTKPARELESRRKGGHLSRAITRIKCA